MLRIGPFVVVFAKRLTSLEHDYDELQAKYNTLYSNHIGKLNLPLRAGVPSRPLRKMRGKGNGYSTLLLIALLWLRF